MILRTDWSLSRIHPVASMKGITVENARFKIGGICACEGSIVEKRLRKLNGVDGVTLSVVTNRLSVAYDPEVVSVEDIEKEVGKAGAKTARV